MGEIIGIVIVIVVITALIAVIRRYRASKKSRLTIIKQTFILDPEETVTCTNCGSQITLGQALFGCPVCGCEGNISFDHPLN